MITTTTTTTATSEKWLYIFHHPLIEHKCSTTIVRVPFAAGNAIRRYNTIEYRATKYGDIIALVANAICAGCCVAHLRWQMGVSGSYHMFSHQRKTPRERCCVLKCICGMLMMRFLWCGAFMGRHNLAIIGYRYRRNEKFNGPVVNRNLIIIYIH